MDKNADNEFYEHLRKIYQGLLNKIDFTKVDIEAKQELESFTRKQLMGKHKSISRSKIKKLFATLVLATPFVLAGVYSSPLSGNGRFLESDEFVTQSGKSTILSFYEDHVKIYDSYILNYDERLDILNQVIDYTKKNEIEIKRGIEKLESEWYIHNVCYNLGISRDNTKDADLDFVQDARWYVNFATDVASLFYSSHKNFDSFQVSNESIESSEVKEAKGL